MFEDIAEDSPQGKFSDIVDKPKKFADILDPPEPTQINTQRDIFARPYSALAERVLPTSLAHHPIVQGITGTLDLPTRGLTSASDVLQQAAKDVYEGGKEFIEKPSGESAIVGGVKTAKGLVGGLATPFAVANPILEDASKAIRSLPGGEHLDPMTHIDNVAKAFQIDAVEAAKLITKNPRIIGATGELGSQVGGLLPFVAGTEMIHTGLEGRKSPIDIAKEQVQTEPRTVPEYQNELAKRANELLTGQGYSTAGRIVSNKIFNNERPSSGEMNMIRQQNPTLADAIDRLTNPRKVEPTPEISAEEASEGMQPLTPKAAAPVTPRVANVLKSMGYSDDDIAKMDMTQARAILVKGISPEKEAQLKSILEGEGMIYKGTANGQVSFDNPKTGDTLQRDIAEITPEGIRAAIASKGERAPIVKGQELGPSAQNFNAAQNMFNRGKSAEEIAGALNIPLNEAESYVKVFRMKPGEESPIGEPPPAKEEQERIPALDEEEAAQNRAEQIDDERRQQEEQAAITQRKQEIKQQIAPERTSTTPQRTDRTEERLSEVRNSGYNIPERNYTKKQPGAIKSNTEKTVLGKIPRGGLDIGNFSMGLVFSPEVKKWSVGERKALLSLLHSGDLKVYDVWNPADGKRTQIIDRPEKPAVAPLEQRKAEIKGELTGEPTQTEEKFSQPNDKEGYYFVRVRTPEGKLLGFLGSRGEIVSRRVLAIRVPPSQLKGVLRAVSDEKLSGEEEFMRFKEPTSASKPEEPTSPIEQRKAEIKSELKGEPVPASAPEQPKLSKDLTDKLAAVRQEIKSPSDVKFFDKDPTGYLIDQSSRLKAESRYKKDKALQAKATELDKLRQQYIDEQLPTTKPEEMSDEALHAEYRDYTGRYSSRKSPKLEEREQLITQELQKRTNKARLTPPSPEVTERLRREAAERGKIQPAPKEQKAMLLDNLQKAQKILGDMTDVTDKQIRSKLEKAGFEVNDRMQIVTRIPGDGEFSVNARNVDDGIERAKGFPIGKSTEANVTVKGGTTASGRAKALAGSGTHIGKDWYSVGGFAAAIKGEFPKGLKVDDLKEGDETQIAQRGKLVEGWAKEKTTPVQKLGYVENEPDVGYHAASETPLATSGDKQVAVFRQGDKYYMVNQGALVAAEKVHPDATYALGDQGRIHLKKDGETVAILTAHYLDYKKRTGQAHTRLELEKKLGDISAIDKTATNRQFVEDLKKRALKALPNLTQKMVDYSFKLMEARAEVWAKQDISRTPEQWFRFHLPDVVMGTTAPEGSLEQRQHAPTWYSRTEQLVDKKMPVSTTVDQLKGILKDAPKEEKIWTGLDKWLSEKSGKVTKQEVMDFLRNNQVEVKEKLLGGGKDAERLQERQRELGEALREADKARAEKLEIGNELGSTVGPYVGYLHGGGTEGEGELHWLYRKPNARGTGVEIVRVPEEYVKRLDDLEAKIERHEDLQQSLADEQEMTGTIGGTSYGTDWLRLAGGEPGTYRELLLTFEPKRSPENKRFVELADKGFKKTEAENAEYRELGQNPNAARPQYNPPHFNEKDLLAHTRFQDRDIPIDAIKESHPELYDRLKKEGKSHARALEMQEFQSDWARQAGEKGIRGQPPTPEESDEYVRLQNRDFHAVNPVTGERRGLSAEEEGRLEELRKKFVAHEEGVPDAPFIRGHWKEMAMRRMIRYAAENGYDLITWTTGEQQADRYDLSKHVKHIDWEALADERKHVSVATKDGTTHNLIVDEKTGRVLNSGQEQWRDKNINEILPKDIAAKILHDESGRIEKEGLKVGGERLKKLYDQAFVNIARDIGKKFGSEPKQVSIYTQDLGKDPEQIKRIIANKGQGWLKEPEPVHSLEITPQMKESVLYEGQPLFQGAKGAVKFATDGTAIIHAFKSADVSTLVHEIAHIFRRDLDPRLLEKAENWAGVTKGEWKTEHEEKFARAFERYLRDGEAPTTGLKEVFQHFKEWLTAIYQKITGSDIDVELTPEIKDVFDKMLGKTEEEEAPKASETPPAGEEKTLYQAGKAKQQTAPPINRGTERLHTLRRMADDFQKWFGEKVKERTGAKTEREKVRNAVEDWEGTISEGLLRAKIFTNLLRNTLSEEDLNNIPRFGEGSKVKISEDAKQVLPQIRKLYDEFFRVEKDAGITSDDAYHENYFNRIWKQPKFKVSSKLSGELMKYFYDKDEAKAFAKENKGKVSPLNRQDIKEYATRFTKYDPFLKKRAIETIEEGEKLGLESKVKNVADLMDIRAQYAMKVTANLKLNKILSGLTDEDGNPMLMRIDKAPPDWEFINNPGLNRAIGHETEDGHIVLTKIPVRANPKVADLVKIISDVRIKPSNRIAAGTLKAIEGLNSVGKFSQLAISLFHHIALTLESVPFATKDMAKQLLDPRNAGATLIGERRLRKMVDNPQFKQLAESLRGRSSILYTKEQSALDAAKHGLVLKAPSEVSRYTIEKLTRGLENVSEKASKKATGSEALGKVGAAPATIINEVVSGNNRLLWDHIHPTVKLMTYEKLVQDGIKKFPERDIDEIKRSAAAYTNDVFGGLNWDRMMVDPKVRQLMELALLAPDWTLSRIRTFYKTAGGTPIEKLSDLIFRKENSLGGPVQGAYARQYWAKAAITFAIMANMANYAFTKIAGDTADNDKDEHGKDIPGSGRGKFLWENDPGNRASIMIGHNDDGSKKYMRWGKAFLEPFEWLADPLGEIDKKKSFIARLIMDQTDENNFEPGFKEKGFYEQLPERAEAAGKAFAPFSLRQNQVLLAQPTSKGMTPYKAVHSLRTAILDGDDEGIKETIKTMRENNIEPQKMIKGAIELIREENVGRIKARINALKRERSAGTMTLEQFQQAVRPLYSEQGKLETRLDHYSFLAH